MLRLLAIAVLLSGCASRIPNSSTVSHIIEARSSVTATRESVSRAQVLTDDLGDDIAIIRQHGDRVDAKSDVINQWEAYQKRKASR